MGIIAKTAGMIVGALVLLIGLGFADPGNSRLMPSFFSTDPPLGVVARGSVDEIGIASAITQFNRDLSAAYRDLDASAVTAAPMAESLRRNFVEEIEYLRKDGRALEMTVRDIRISEVRRLQNLMLSVDTIESVRIRYLSVEDRREIRAQPETRYTMNYTLQGSRSGWTVAAVETLDAGQRNE